MNPIERHNPHVILVNTSAGKDSQAMLDEVVTMAEKAGLADRIVAVHCDLGRVEWQGVRFLAELQANRYGVRFEVVSRPQGDLLDHVRQRGMWPSPSARYCTSDHKRGQVFKLITRLVAELRSEGVTERIRILNCLGLRAEESPARAKRPVLRPNKKASNGKRQVWDWLPIHGWTESDVWDRIRSSGVPHHWAYDVGMPRLSCCFCIFAPRSALILAGHHNRDLLDEYCAVEEEIGHTFKRDLSLAEVREAVDRGEAATCQAVTCGAWNM